MVTDEKLIEALKLIKKNCTECRECSECIFYTRVGEYACSLLWSCTSPSDWAIEYKTVKTVIL